MFFQWICRFTSIALLFPAAAMLARSPGQASAPEKISELLRRDLSSEGPGAIIVAARNGAAIVQCARGTADLEKKIPITADTVFDLASCSKQFTAMAVMVLADRGMLSFDDDARRFLPELAAHDPPVRVSDLLHMTSGLPDYEKLLEHLEDKTNMDVLHAVASRPLLFATGSKFNYCDTNYVLLALMVERVSGRSFAQFLKSEIFDRAGMNHSVVLETPGQAIANRAAGYSRDRTGAVKPSREDTKTYGDGQVMTTASDMLKWDRALRENTFVKPQTLALAFSAGKLSDGKTCGYGFGWFVEPKSGGAVVHSGKWFGTSTCIRHQFDGLTVIVLSNLEQFPAQKAATRAAALVGSEVRSE